MSVLTILAWAAVVLACWLAAGVAVVALWHVFVRRHKDGGPR
ncbi:hypothetical protein [Streptomyces sp. NBC_01216]|nr:hypothetical protein OG393_31935 [Streptomyces sp. NBC_01216]